MITRRRLITNATTALIAGALAPRMVWANTSVTMGNMTIDTLSDGHLVLPRSMTLPDDLPAAELATILEKYNVGGDQFMPDCNVTLIRAGDRVILMDAGAGSEFMPTAGKLLDALSAVDVDPADVTHVVFTHAHPDHLWGVLDDFDDLTFPNATYMMGQTEWDYWTNSNTVDTIDPGRIAFAVGAKRRLDVIADNMTFFGDGAEILPGIAARACFGHTPGHMALHLAQGSQEMMILGDCIANHHVAFERPAWHSGSDQDGDMGAAARTSLLDQVASAQMHIIGFHLPYPGIGRAEKRDDGYVFAPD